MGIVKISDLTGNLKGQFGIWELAESSQSLLKEFQLSDSETEEFVKISNEKRKCEFLAVRLLLQQMLQEKTEIRYNYTGKPFLNNSSYHISIAHSCDLAIVLLTDKNSGTDVEKITRNTDKIADRFLSKDERRWIGETTNPQLTQILCWCAKEAIYKNACLPDIEFQKNIFIQPFHPLNEGGTFRCELNKNARNTSFFLTYFFFRNNVIVFSVEE
jgi:4'-phosphopantetheinyl transferase